MNQAMEMLRAKAAAVYAMVAGDSEIVLQIDPIEPLPMLTEQGEKLKREITAQILQRTEFTEQLEDGLTRNANAPLDPCIAHLNWMFEQQGKLKVWIYNISHQEHTLDNGYIKHLRVPACPKGEEYTVVTALPAVIIHGKENVDSNEVDYLFTDGRRMAMDLINPSNLGLDQDANINSVRALAVGNDFSKKGLFFSTHNPPLKKELKAANKRLAAYYEDLIVRANLVRITSAAGTLGVPVAEVVAAVEYVEGLRTTR